MNIGDLFMRVVANLEGFAADLDKEAGKAGTKAGTTAGTTMGQSIKASIKKSWSGAELGKGLVQGLGLAGGLGAAQLLTKGLGAVTGAVGDAIESLKRIEVINSQTAAAIKSTGGAANVTAGAVEAYAHSIENLTGVEAETVQEGENLLLTFTEIKNGVGKGNDIFNQATAAMTDMAVAMANGDGKAADMSATAIQLGKALNDPIKGLTALGKVGVAFTAQQKAQIKAMVQAGDVMGAQKVILAELNKEFGGSAKAWGETEAGKIEKANNRIGDSFETLAAGALPLIADGFGAAAEAVEGLTGSYDEFNQAVDRHKTRGFVDEKDLGLLENTRREFEAIGGFLEMLGEPLKDTADFFRGTDGAAVAAMQHMADASKDDLVTVKKGLGGVGDAAEDIEQKAADAAAAFDKAMAEIVGSVSRARSELATAASDVANATFDPLLAKAELVELELEAKRLRGVRDAAKRGSEERQEAENTLLGVNKKQIEVLGVLASYGDASAAKTLKSMALTALGSKNLSNEARGYWNNVLVKLIQVEMTAKRLAALRFMADASKDDFVGHASGGLAKAWEPTWVGERGKELLIPTVDSTIMSHPQSIALASTAGTTGPTYNTTVNNPEPRAADDDIGRMLRRLSALGI